jgi:FAD/FMN-containing dehydrogenase/Fe-S oxidoreductase
MNQELRAALARRRRSALPHNRPDVSGLDVAALRAALEEAVEGDVRFDVQARAVYSTDASNYREVPIGAVLPRSAEDVVRAVEICRRFGAPVLSRGGGTSLAGQCCNVAVVIDFTKYMNRILELDAQARTAWVEPGCVLDDLRAAAEEHGLTFGPDPSTHDHCTLGGMAGNNSCGVHSVMAGRTSDNIEAMEILTYDGERMLVGPTPDEELERIIAGGGRRGEIYAALRSLRDRYGDLVRARYPQIPRRVSGFNLDDLLPEKGFNVARALVGSEGTGVAILRIKCRLLPSPPKPALLVLGFEDVNAAADAVPRMREAGAIAIEGIDAKFVEFMRANHLHVENLDLLPGGNGWLFVEFGGDSAEESREKAQKVIDGYRGAADAPDAKLVTDEKEQKGLWVVRKAGLPATADVPGLGKTYEGWEDSAVAPERLGAYIRDFRKLLDEFGYDTALYGHFGDGLIHCRIDFDLTNDQGRAKFRRFIDRAADLVLSHGGSLSGEHGDGQSRGALLTKMFGEELVGAFRGFKTIWDPDWKMNPGKVVLPDAPTEDIRAPRPRPGWEAGTRLAFGEDGHDISKAAARCVGVGDCRKHDHGIMCPSYMATYNEAYSTRGRERLLWEMLEGEAVPDGWRSDAVHEALDFCLACKGCLDECPVRVDMASYKAEFMHHHWKGRIRPRAAYSMGLIWWWMRAGSKLPRLVNTLAHTRPFSGAAKWAGGFAPQREIPTLANPDFRTWFRRREKRPGSRGRVLLWPDTFNTYMTPEPLKAAVGLLEGAGWQVDIPERPVCCGRPLYAVGFLDLAGRLWRRTLETLRPHVEAGTAIVGLEPGCVSSFRHELLQMRPDDPQAKALSERTLMLSEFLLREGYEPPRIEGRAKVHAHCHHKSVMGADTELDLLRKTGLEVEMLDNGCCGMAGDYGFRKETYGVAMKVGERAFLPSFRNAGDALYLANGFSCREQARQATGRSPLTLPELLAAGSRAAAQAIGPAE